MKIDDLRDELALEITKIILLLCNRESMDQIREMLTYSYPMADAVLSRRNVSRPIITRVEERKA